MGLEASSTSVATDGLGTKSLWLVASPPDPRRVIQAAKTEGRWYTPVIIEAELPGPPGPPLAAGSWYSNRETARTTRISALR